MLCRKSYPCNTRQLCHEQRKFDQSQMTILLGNPLTQSSYSDKAQWLDQWSHIQMCLKVVLPFPLTCIVITSTTWCKSQRPPLQRRGKRKPFYPSFILRPVLFHLMLALSSACKLTRLILQIGCPLYRLTSWRKSILIQKNLVQIPKYFNQYGIAKKYIIYYIYIYI